MAVDENSIVGYAQFMAQDICTAHLTRIYVLPARQRQGIGRRLLPEGISALVAQGLERVIVQVEKDNISGNQFYVGNNFRFERELSIDLSGDSLELCQYVLFLSPTES